MVLRRDKRARLLSLFSPTVWWWQDRRHSQGDTVGQILHGSATTTHAVRAAIQRSKASLQALSKRYGINPKTVAKWRRRTSLEDRPMGPPVPRSTVLSTDEETLVVAFRRHTLLPLDDCLYALQATIPISRDPRCTDSSNAMGSAVCRA